MRWRENLRVVALNVISHETKARGARRSAVAVQRRVRKRVSSSSSGVGACIILLGRDVLREEFDRP
jgi:hypothetical protein